MDVLSFSLVFAWVGVFILAWRIIPRQRQTRIHIDESQPWPKVSLVIPARNEEHNLDRLLKSLQQFDYPSYEIFVVDDHSTDRTQKIAQSYGVTVLSSADLPEGWNGKNWACHQAVPSLTGDIFLFTDADTEHLSDGLKRGVRYFQKNQLDLMSSFPYHKVETWWEKLLGPFHTILMAACAPYTPRPKRLFSIGQYLMFSKESYHKQGGHAEVRNQYPDDLALANACLKQKGKFGIFAGPPLFEVRMYKDFKEFVDGWRRNFLAGMQQSNIWATLEVILIYCGLTGSGKLFVGDAAHALPAVLGLLLILCRQQTWGKFSLLGILFFPVSLILFLFITLISTYDRFTGNVLRWKGRSYTGWVPKSSSH